MHADYTGQGFDQLLDVIDKIKNNPDDRRIVLSAWNPSDLKLMALPPCHMFAQVKADQMFSFFCHAFLFVYHLSSIRYMSAVLRSKWGAILSNVSTVC